MTLILKMSDEPERDETDHTMSTPRQQAFNKLMEWQTFLRFLEVLCVRFGWSLECGDVDSFAVFSNIDAEDDADVWQQKPLLFDESLEQENSMHICPLDLTTRKGE